MDENRIVTDQDRERAAELKQKANKAFASESESTFLHYDVLTSFPPVHLSFLPLTRSHCAIVPGISCSPPPSYACLRPIHLLACPSTRTGTGHSTVTNGSRPRLPLSPNGHYLITSRTARDLLLILYRQRLQPLDRPVHRGDRAQSEGFDIMEQSRNEQEQNGRARSCHRRCQ